MTVTARAPGDLLTAAIFNTKLEAPIVVSELGAVPLCVLTHSLGQTVPNGTAQVLTWDTEIEDAGAMHSVAVNPSRITIVTPGVYAVRAHILFPVNATGYRLVWFTVNGAGDFGHTTILPVANDYGTAIASFEMRLAAGEWVDVRVAHDAGVTLTLPSFGGQLPAFSARWVNP
jgi:hypothetical protein